jgi:ketosteroid isomerase-like protein
MRKPRAILSRANVTSANEESPMREIIGPIGSRACRAALALGLCVIALLCAACPAGAQQKDKKNKDAAKPAASTASGITLSDEQQIDYLISSMLGAWQVGDADKLHEAYADDVTIVAGTYIPPVVGWSNYLPLYQQQRARMQQVRMDRSNTLVKLSGACAWATYQWDFSATVDGQPSVSQGHTTLVMEKRNGKWVITLNHTSVAEQSAAKPAGAAAPSQPH